MNNLTKKKKPHYCSAALMYLTRYHSVWSKKHKALSRPTSTYSAHVAYYKHRLLHVAAITLDKRTLRCLQ